jgi:hypothetical protein
MLKQYKITFVTITSRTVHKISDNQLEATPQINTWRTSYNYLWSSSQISLQGSRIMPCDRISIQSETQTTNFSILYAWGSPWPTGHKHPSQPRALWGPYLCPSSYIMPSASHYCFMMDDIATLSLLYTFSALMSPSGLFLPKEIKLFHPYFSWTSLATSIILWPSGLWHYTVLHGKVTIYHTSVARTQSIVCVWGKMWKGTFQIHLQHSSWIVHKFKI